MRFTLHTDDGLSFVIKDRGKVFARGVAMHQISQAIGDRRAGDEWRSAAQRMCGKWNGSANQHLMRSEESEWAKWARTRGVTWRTRSRAVVNAIRRGDYEPNSGLHIQSRVNKQRAGIATWAAACESMARNYKTEWSKKDEWHKWSVNTASNHRKRLRNKEERTAQEVVGFDNTKDV